MEQMHTELTSRYSDTLARRFPVMCASDAWSGVRRGRGRQTGSRQTGCVSLCQTGCQTGSGQAKPLRLAA